MNDAFDRSIYHRRLKTGVNDTPLFTLAQRLIFTNLQRSNQGAEMIQPDSLNGVVASHGARVIELAFYALAGDGGTVVINVAGIPTILPRLPESQADNGPRLLRLCTATVTFGTSTESGLNPITGEVDTGTWRAADTIAVTVTGTGISLYDEGGLNGIARLAYDPLGCPHTYCFVSGMSNVTVPIVQARRLLAPRLLG